MFHPSLSPSPLQNAFAHVPWTYHNDIGGGGGSPSNYYSGSPTTSSSPILTLSKPELLLLQSAEEHPLEYTLAEFDDAFLWIRVLLKLLDQVTGPSDGTNGLVSTTDLGTLHNKNNTRAILSEEDAMQVLAEDKAAVVVHYIISRLYEIMGLLVEKEQKQLHTVSQSRSVVTISTLFYHSHRNSHSNSHPQLIEDWRPLLRILYRSGSDDYTKRGAALVLAYILKAGCAEQTRDFKQPSKSRTEENLLLPPLQHDKNFMDASQNAINVTAGSTTNMVEETLQSLISWLTSRLQSSHHNASLGVVTPTLMVLATTPQARRAFDQAGGIGYLTRHVKQFHRNHQRSKQLSRKRQHQRTRSSYTQCTRSLSLSDHNNSSDKKRDDTTAPVSLQSVTDSVSIVAQHLRSNSITSPTARVRRSSNATNGNSNKGGAFFSNATTSSPISGTASPLMTSTTSPSSSSLVSQVANMVVESSPTVAAMVVAASSAVMETTTSNAGDSDVHRLSPQASPNSSMLRRSIVNGYSPSHASQSNRNSPSSLQNNSSPLAGSSSSSSSVQQLYELVFTLWCMTLDCCPNGGNVGSGGNDSVDEDAQQTVRQHFARDGAIPALVQLLQTAPREKVLRLALASLRIFATLDDNSSVQQISLASSSSKTDTPTATPVIGSAAFFIQEMIACDIQKSFDFLQQRHWNDPDLQDDLDILSNIVHHHTCKLTQWKVYQAEVDSGVLRWDSHLHTSDFFLRNYGNMEGPNGDFAPLVKLVQILFQHTQVGCSSLSSRTYYVGLKEVAASGDDQAPFGSSWNQDDINDDELCESLAVALYDIGEFARHYPNGRAVLATAGRQQSMLGRTKGLVMQYMQYPREEVQQQALLCASKLLVKNWRAIGSSGKA